MKTNPLQASLHTILLSVIFCSLLSAQNQNWYFGFNAGLSFNSTTPTPLTNGQLNSYEGCAVISNSKGNLLFYSDGQQVWNRNHSIMFNGTGLHGHVSTTQGALIVPDPGDTNKYYLFTLDQLGSGNGLKYSIVDMSLQSGNGAVTSKNTIVHFNVTEKLSAIQRCDGNIWIIYHIWQSNTFVSRLLTASGIGPAVNSSVGISHIGGGSGYKNSIGFLKNREYRK